METPGEDPNVGAATRARAAREAAERAHEHEEPGPDNASTTGSGDGAARDGNGGGPETTDTATNERDDATGSSLGSGRSAPPLV